MSIEKIYKGLDAQSVLVQEHLKSVFEAPGVPRELQADRLSPPPQVLRSNTRECLSVSFHSRVSLLTLGARLSQDCWRNEKVCFKL